MRQYIGIIRDHSGSMGHLANRARQDYNEILDEMKASFGQINTKMSVVKCGFRDYRGSTGNVTEFTGIPLSDVTQITSYVANGSSTPLFDAVGQMIQLLQNAKSADDGVNGWNLDQETAFLLIVITDGQENASKIWYANNLRSEIDRLQATDKWTFVFRVPPGYKTSLVNKLRVHEGNVVEWEQSEQGLAASTIQTTSAIRSYASMRASGATSTDRFYANVTHIADKEIKNYLTDISHRVTVFEVPRSAMGKEIRPFVEQNLGLQYVVGSAYYQLSKTETIQPQKQLILRNDDGKFYSGGDARRLMGIPTDRSFKIVPGNLGGKKLFIQSTSVNRHLMGDTQLVIYR